MRDEIRGNISPGISAFFSAGSVLSSVAEPCRWVGGGESRIVPGSPFERTLECQGGNSEWFEERMPVRAGAGSTYPTRDFEKSNENEQ